jgi:predicted TIM-barrel fold metal-dependent hydrolase
MIVDVHGHVTHPELFKRFPMPAALADIEGMLEQKAAAGIELTIVGSPVGYGTMMPVPGFDAFSQPLDQLQAFHEWLAETVRQFAPRLAAYAFTNPFGGDELLEQTARTVRDGGFVGLIVNTSVQGRYLDSDGADDFFAMVSELDVPIFLHPPAEPVGASSFDDFRLVEQVGRFLDVTSGLAALVFGGRLARDPELKIVAATAGGAIGLLAGRLDQASKARPGGPPGPAAETTISEPPSVYLRQVYVDTANSSLPNQLANLELMGPQRLLFGTDSPPLATPLHQAIELVRRLPISEDEQEDVLHRNAERLFKLGTSAPARNEAVATSE